MRSNEVTIDEVLKTADYTTGCFGKWQNSREYPYHTNGRRSAFDRFDVNGAFPMNELFLTKKGGQISLSALRVFQTR